MKGELGVISYADSPSIFAQLTRVYLQQGASFPRKFVLQGVREHQGGLLLALEGIYSRELAQAWVGALLMVRRRDLPRLAPGEIYIFELLGCQVFVQDGRFLGQIQEVKQTGGQEVWSIVTPEGREVLFPVVDHFILELDVTLGRAVIAPPPGLLEIYLKGMES